MAKVYAKTAKQQLEELKALIAQAKSDPKMLDKIDMSTLQPKTKGMSNPEIIQKGMTGMGLVDRRFIMNLLGYQDAVEADEESEEYRHASKNIASPMTALKKTLGDKWYEYQGQYAILSDDELAEINAFNAKIGQPVE